MNSHSVDLLRFGIVFGLILAIIPGGVAHGAEEPHISGWASPTRDSSKIPELLSTPSERGAVEFQGDGLDIWTNEVASEGSEPALEATVDAENMEFVSQIGGRVLAISVQENYAYIGEHSRVTILDISDPASPTVIGKTPVFPGVVNDVCTSGSYAYAADNTGLRVVDISDPANPTELGSVDTSGAASVHASGDIAYVAGGLNGLLWMIDISDPANPAELGSYQAPGSAADVYIYEKIAYVAAGTAGLRMVDMNEPANATEIGSYRTFGSAANVYVSESIAYVTAGERGFRIVEVIDVRNPANPTELGSFDIPSSPTDLFVSGGVAYVVDKYNGLRLVDVSDPAHPAEVGSFSVGSNGIYVTEGIAYLAANARGLRLVNVSDPSKPSELGSYDSLSSSMRVSVSGEIAYVADWNEGLRIVDVSDPTHPTELTSFAPGRAVTDVFVSGGIAYATGPNSLWVVDVADPVQPFLLGSTWVGYGSHVTVRDEIAYVATNYGLQIVDVSDPTYPARLGIYLTSYSAEGVDVSADVAYVTSCDGLAVVDISDPTSPTELGLHPMSDCAYGVSVSGEIAYVSSMDRLLVLDVSDPASPTELASIGSLAGRDIDVSGGIAYIAFGSLWVLDVSDPSNPAQLGYHPTLGCALDVTTSGDYFYVADFTGGLLILRYTGGLLSISGRVQDSDGKPISSVNISAGSGGSVTTDATGAYTIAGLITGTYALTPIKSGWTFSPETRMVSVPPSATGQDFVAAQTYTISGFVRTDTGLPVQGVAMNSFWFAPVETDENGYYEITGMGAGTYGYTPVKQGHTFEPDFVTATVPPSAPGQDVTVVSVDIGFLPNRDGFKFANHKTVRTWDMFKQFFGQRATEFPDGSRRPEAWTYYKEKYEDHGASCDGFSSTTLLNFEKLDQANAGQYEMPSYNPLYAESKNDDIEDAIAYHQGIQCSLELKIHMSELSEDSGDSPSYMYEAIKGYMVRDQPITLWLLKETSGDEPEGHSVVPYRYEQVSENRGHVYVYDSNHPGDSDRKVIFNLREDRWLYEMNRNDSGDVDYWFGYSSFPSLSIFPLDMYLQPGTPVWLHPLSPDAYVCATSSLVKPLFVDAWGNKIGFVDGDFVNETAKAEYLPPVVRGSSKGSGSWYLPDGTYDLTLRGAGNGEYTYLAFGNRSLLELRSSTQSSATVDNLKFGESNSTLVYTSTDAFKEYSASLDQGYEAFSRMATISATISAGDITTLTMDNATLNYANAGSTKTYDITLEQFGAFAGSFNAHSISIGGGDTHSVEVEDWNNLETTTIRVTIDSASDGSIDDELVLQNSGFTTFLPLVLRQ